MGSLTKSLLNRGGAVGIQIYNPPTRTLLYEEQAALVKRDSQPRWPHREDTGGKAPWLHFLLSDLLLGLPLARHNQQPKAREPVHLCHTGQPPGWRQAGDRWKAFRKANWGQVLCLKNRIWAHRRDGVIGWIWEQEIVSFNFSGRKW